MTTAPADDFHHDRGQIAAFIGQGIDEVAEGVIELRRDDGGFQRYVAGDAIALGAGPDEIPIANLSDEVQAREILADLPIK